MNYLLLRSKSSLSGLLCRFTFILALLFSFGIVCGQTVRTDFTDYLPGDIVIITGTGWQPGETVQLKIEHITFSSHPTEYLSTISDANGNIFNDKYMIDAWDIGETFLLTATGLTSNLVATTTFTDGGGDYSFDFSAYDPSLYLRKYPAQVSMLSGRGLSPLNTTAVTVESLEPSDLGLGQIVAFEFYLTVKASGTCMNDIIQFTGRFDTQVTSGGNFGFDDTYGIYAAFVDLTAGKGLVDPGNNATVTDKITWLGNGFFDGTITVSGLDPGDVIPIEVWVVLKNTIPAKITGNVQTALMSAKTLGTCAPNQTISTGNQTVPLLQVGEFDSVDADLSVTKTANPVCFGENITYTINATNNSEAIVANLVVINDVLGPNQAFVSATAQSGTFTQTGQNVTFNVGPISPLESKVFTIEVTPTIAGLTVTNTATISALTDDPVSTNNTSTVSADVYALPFLAFEVTPMTYFGGSNGAINLTVTGGSSPYTYNWSGPEGFSTSSEDLTGLSIPGWYSVTVTDAHGCQAVEQVEINPSNLAEIAITPTPITCYNSDGYSADGAIDLTVTGGPGTPSYVWTGPSGYTGSTSEDLMNLNIPGIYYVTINFTLDGVVVGTANMQAEVLAPTYQCLVSAGNDVSICYGDEATLTALASGGVEPYTYEWFDDAALTNSIGSNSTIIVNPAATKSYYVKTTDKNGCYGIDEVRVTVLSVPVCSIDGDASICPSGTATYSGPEGEGLSYSWSISGDASIDGANVSKLVTVESSGDCDGRFTLILTVTNEDNCSSICERTVALIDETPPTFASCPTTSIDLGCNPEKLPNSAMAIAAVGTITDNCDADVAVTATGGEITGDCTKTQVWTVLADADCGPDATCTVTYRWKEDLELPVITTTTEDAYLGCSPSSTDIGIALGSATALDNCDGNISYRVISQNGPVFTENGCLYVMTRTFDVTDLCGNAAVQKTVKVTWTRDYTAPTFASCPTTSIDLGCNPVLLPDESMAIGDAGEVLDNCDASVTVTASGGEITGDCTKTQVWTVLADADCGTDATCTVTYRWKEDLELPVITTTTEDAYLGCSPTSTEIGIALGSATALDNCDGNISYRIISQNGPVFTENGCLYAMTRTFDVTDLCGNAAVQKTVKVTWTRDYTAPTFASCPTTSIDLGCNPEKLPNSAMAIAAVGTITDNCDADVAVTATGGEITGDCTKTQVWTVLADADCGPDAECLVTYTWTIDIQPPVFIACPASPINLGCNPAPVTELMAITAAGQVRDECGQNIAVSAVGGNITGDCVKTQVWTVTAATYCGPSAICLVTYTWIEDNTPPMWDQELPSAEIILECGETLPNLALTATDICGGVTYTAISNITLGECPIIELGGRRITATDVCGNSISFAQGFKIMDTTPPVWNQTMPGDLLVECGNVPLFPSGLTASDKCDDNVEVYISEDNWVFDICGYEIIRTFTARDDCGNTSVHKQTITVAPAPAPKLTIHSIDKFPQTMSCADANNWENLLGSYMYASYTNGQSGNCLISGEVGPTVYEDWTLCAGGTLTFVWEATELCEYHMENTHVISVLPAPTAYDILLPTLPTSLTCAEASAFISAPDATYTNGEAGGCEISGTLSASLQNNWTMCDGGSVKVIYLGVDPCGTPIVLEVVIPVSKAPVAQLNIPTGIPAWLSCSDAANFTSVPDAYYGNGATGTCENSGLIQATVTHNWTTCAGGTIEIVWSGIDDCGNALRGSWTIYVYPAPDPVLTIPSGLPTSLSCTEAALFTTAPEATYTNGETGECGIDGTITALVIPRWDPCRGGDIVIVWEKVVECNYHFEEFYVILVSPAPAPTLTLPLLPSSISCAEAIEFVSAPPATYSNGETGDCERIGTISANIYNNWNSCEGGFILVTYEGKDACEYGMYERWSIEVRPAPTATLSIPVLPTSISCSEAAAYTSVADATFTNGESGTCENSGSIPGVIVPDWNMCYGGYITVKWEGTDYCGRILSNSWTIKVRHALPTVLSVPDLPDYLSCAEADVFETPSNATYTNGEIGGCLISGSIAASVIHDWTLCNGGTITVTYSGTDQCGQLMEFAKSITVEGALPASFLEFPDEISMSCDEYETFEPSYLAYSNAGPLKMAVASCLISGEVLGELSGDYDACEGTMNQTWTFTDLCGRTITHMQEIHLFDNTPPVINQLTDVTLGGCNPDWPIEIVADWSDNCSAGGQVSGVGGDVVTDACQQYRYYTFNVLDDCFNPAIEVKMKVTRKYDITPPDFVVPADLMVDMSGNCTYDIDPSVTGSPTKITDNCVGDLTINYSDSDPIAGDCAGNLTIVRAWRVADACNNATVKRQVISIADNEPPVLVGCPSDVTICENEVMAPIIAPIATDNCDTSVPVTWTRSDKATGLNDKFELGVTTITFMVMDDCGNSASCEMKVTVNQAPDITVQDLTECSIDEGGTTAVFALEDAITSITFPSGTAVFVSSLHGQILSTQEALDNYIGTDGELITITLTTLDECSASAAFTLYVNPRQVLAVQDLTTCSAEEGGKTASFDLEGAIITLGGGTVKYYSGTPLVEITDISAYVGTDGELITVKATSTEDCETTETFTLHVDPRPVLTVEDLTECSTDEDGSQASYDLEDAIVTLTGGTAQYYSGTPLVEITDISAYVGSDGELITVKATSSDGCETTKTFTLNVDPRPVLTVEDLTECSTDEDGSQASFDLEDAIVTLTGGTAQYYSGTPLVEITDISAYVGSDGELITVKATSSDGCETTKTFTLNVDPRPVLTVEDLTECSTAEGGTTATFDFLANVSAIGGNLAFSSNINGSLLLAQMDAYVGTDGEIITVSSTSSAPTLCQTIKSFTINVQPRPILKDATITYCEDEFTNFDITVFNDDVLASGQNIEDFEFVWSSNASPTMPTMAVPSANTEYTVSVTNKLTQCSSVANLTVTVNLCSWLNLTKTTNKVVVDALNWTFVLYEGEFGNWTQIASETTQGVMDGVLFRSAGPLSRYSLYTVCELGVPAGYGTTWMIDPELDGVFLTIPYTTSPGTDGVYNPNSVDLPPQDLGNRCYTFDGSMLPINNYGSETPLALQLLVDNTFPGGDARTPGYWKNWNTCTGGGQQYTADENAYELDGIEGVSAYDRVYSGWALLDDIIYLFGITWGEFELTTCADAQFILDNRDLLGVNRASDPAYTLAKHLLAYQLNQGAGSYICYDMTPIETEAVNLLVTIGFEGIGDYLRKTTSPTMKALASRAVELAAVLDAYNNNLGCEGLAEMISGVPPTPPDPELMPLSCTTTVTNISKKAPVGKVVVNAVGGTSPYMFSMDGGLTTQTSNEFTINAAGTYTFTVTDKSEPMQTCTCTAKVTSTVKSAAISAIVLPGDEIASELKVYPNPFTSAVFFEFVPGCDANARLEIFNMLGQKVSTLLDQRVEMGVLKRIEYRPLATPGVLFYRLSLDDEIFNGKLIYNKE